MNRILFLRIVVLFPTLLHYANAQEEAKESPKRSVWELKNEKMQIQVFKKEKPWPTEEGKMLSDLLGFDVTNKVWYYALVDNLQKNETLLFESDQFSVILKNRKQVEGLSLSFQNLPFVKYEKKVKDDQQKYERLLELEDMIEFQTILPEASHSCIFIFENDVEEKDIFKLYFEYITKYYPLENKLKEMEEPEL